MSKLSIAPTTNLIHAMRNSGLKWPTAIGELVDNSFDAGATRVTLCFDGKSNFSCEDDGNGTDSIASMFTLGDHHATKSTRLGMYGVGLKDTSLWLMGVTSVHTVCGGKLRTAIVDWHGIEKSGRWEIDAPTESETKLPSGTRICFSRITKSTPSDINGLAKDLGYKFFPALRDGRQIVIQRKRAPAVTVRAYQLPPLQKTIDELVEIDGRKFHLHAGIVSADAVNSKPGFSIVYGHRVIGNSPVVDGKYSVGRIAGIITLKSGWSMTKNKEGLSDDDCDFLSSVVTAKCQEILDLSQQLENVIVGAEFTSELNEAFQCMISNYKNTRREVRGKDGECSGTVTPAGTGRKRSNAAKSCDKPGSVVARINRGMSINIVDTGSVESIGMVDRISRTISLNGSHPFIARLRDEKNKDALLLAACMLISHEHERDAQNERPLLKTETTDFAQTISVVLAGQQHSNRTLEALSQ